MFPVDFTELSPVCSNEFPCFGAHYMQVPDQKVPYAYAVKVGIKKTDGVCEMLVKIPLSAHQKEVAKILVNELMHGSYPVSVAFEGLKCYRNKFGDKIIFSATADSFKIMEGE